MKKPKRVQLCIVCHRPLPEPRGLMALLEWWMPRPPTHDMSKDAECARALREELGQ